MVKPDGCNKWINDAINFLEKDNNVKYVFLGFRHTAFLYGDQKSVYLGMPNYDPSKNITSNSLDNIGDDIISAYWDSYSKIIQRLTDSGKIVFHLYPIPELPDNITKYVYPFSIFSSAEKSKFYNGIPVSYYKKRNSSVISELDKITNGINVIAVDPFKSLCNERYCPFVKSGSSLYFDDNHLSVSGAEIISSDLLKMHRQYQKLVD